MRIRNVCRINGLHQHILKFLDLILTKPGVVDKDQWQTETSNMYSGGRGQT